MEKTKWYEKIALLFIKEEYATIDSIDGFGILKYKVLKEKVYIIDFKLLNKK